MKKLLVAMSVLCAASAVFGQVKGAKYLRWWFTAIEGGELDGTPQAKFTGNCHGMQISEIRLVKGGEEIAWPAGTTCTINSRHDNQPSTTVEYNVNASKIIDNNVDTKEYITDNSSSSGNYMYARYFEITLPEATDFDSYVLYTADDDYDRDPTRFHMDVSADGQNWYTIDNAHLLSVPSTRKALFYTSPEVGLDLTTPGAANITSGEVFFTKYRNAISAQKVRLTITEMYNKGGTLKDNFLQLSEFAPTLGTRRLPYTGGTCVDVTDNKYDSDDLKANFFYDGQVKNGEAKCWHPNVKSGDNWLLPITVEIDFNRMVMFDGFDICCGDPQGDNYRVPGKFFLEALVPGTENEWVKVVDADITDLEKYPTCPWRRENVAAYRLWSYDYFDNGGKMLFQVNTTDKRLLKCNVLPNDAITVAADAKVSLVGVSGAVAEDSELAGTMTLDNSRIDISGLTFTSAIIDGTGVLELPADATIPPAGATVSDTIAFAHASGTVTINDAQTLVSRAKFKAVRMLMFSQLKKNNVPTWRI